MTLNKGMTLDIRISYLVNQLTSREIHFDLINFIQIPVINEFFISKFIKIPMINEIITSNSTDHEIHTKNDISMISQQSNFLLPFII